MGRQAEESKGKRRLCTGLFAHVDAGKTTLSEGLLYTCGCLKRLGRVDHQDAFLDTYALERERGITIFSKQAVLPLEDMVITLLDTPGHVDFSAEMERTLQVLDCAILVISGTDGVQGHTMTLWRLLERYGVPVFLFVNKMDLAGADRDTLLSGLKARLDEGCVDFGPGQDRDSWLENVAVCGEDVLERYLETGEVAEEDIAALIRARKLFPCYFGSALRLEGVEELLSGLSKYGTSPDYPPEFGARVYKIARDPQGNRLTYLKVTGGSLKVKALLTNRRAALAEEKVWEEKADQIRIYSGAKFTTVDEAPAGDGVRRHRPEPYRARRGPGLGGGGGDAGAGAGAHLPGGAARGLRPPHRPPQAGGAGRGGPPAPHRLERAAAGDPHPAHGGGPAGGAPAAHWGAVRAGRHL